MALSLFMALTLAGTPIPGTGPWTAHHWGDSPATVIAVDPANTDAVEEGEGEADASDALLPMRAVGLVTAGDVVVVARYYFDANDGLLAIDYEPMATEDCPILEKLFTDNFSTNPMQQTDYDVIGDQVMTAHDASGRNLGRYYRFEDPETAQDLCTLTIKSMDGIAE